MTKSPLRAAILALLSPLLLACEQDAYDKGEGSLSLLRADLVEAHVDAAKNVDYVVTDEGQQLTIDGQLTARWLTQPDTVYRAILYYQQQGNTARDASIGQVATLTMRRPDFFKGNIKTDPVRFESAWVSNTRRYLNAGIYLMMGNGDDDDKAIHTLGLVGDTLTTNADGTRTWHMRLWHDQGGVPEYFAQRTYLSIPLYRLDADSLCLSINTYEGVVEKTFRVR